MNHFRFLLVYVSSGNNKQIDLFVKPSVGEFAQVPDCPLFEVWIIGEKCVTW